MADLAGEIGADYSHRLPNCNAASESRGPRLPGFLCPAKGKAQAGEIMALSSSRSKSKAARKATPPKAKARPGDGADGETLNRVAAALERLAPAALAEPDFDAAEAFVWHPEGRKLAAVRRVNRVEMSLLKGIDRVRDLLVENTERFARGLPANNALLWGARGMGKSSLVKAAHASIGAAHSKAGLKLIEIHREDIESLPELMGI